jgi:hypothetical protein
MHKRPAAVLISAVILTTTMSAMASASVEADQDPESAQVVLFSAEALTADGSGPEIEYFLDAEEMPPWIQQDLGNKQTLQDYVYNDPRRALFNGGIPGVAHGVQEANTSADAGLSDQIGWMYRAVDTWDAQQCAAMDLTVNDIDADRPGIVERFFATGALTLTHQADLTQVGFRSPGQFPYFAANPNVLGVAFTLVWVNPDGTPSDIDGNGKTDVAFREIYYNDAFEWVDDGVLGERGSGVFDFPAVAIHEVGHGLSQAHFGNIARNDDGSITARPKAIMNAIYGGIQRDLLGTDVAGHCSNWTNWPIQ